ncbi:GNAT family N-acetyltransferase [Kitasatospora sp. NPDC096147]|uniref:GNAT family N-acetyltransferase n=1 Tax=Kitasatospora sp. NPDC096147 TaxID=3364093 RepID=UPI00381D57D5
MLKTILDAAAAGRFPAADGSVTVVQQPSERDAGVVAFSAHAVVFTDQDPEWVRAAVAAAPSDELAAPMNPHFLAAFADRTGRRMDTIDLLSAGSRLPGEAPLPLAPLTDRDHPRIVRALDYREDVRVWTVPGGVLILGRGLAGRWECAIEVSPEARGRGLGRDLALSARHLLPEGDHVWAQQSPGNVPSVRSFQAAGFRPVGAEALMIPRQD